MRSFTSVSYRQLTRWDRQFVSDRNVVTHINSVNSINQIQSTGLPQGSVTGPKFYILYSDDLNDLELDENTLIKEFADDCIESSAGISPEGAIALTNKSLIPITSWYKNNLLMINPLKTKTLILSTTNVNYDSLPPVVVDTIDTEFCSNLKYLGIILDSQLSLKDHILQLTSRVSYKLNIFQQIRPFLDTNTSKLFYISYIRPLLEYCPALLNSINKTSSDKLESLQNRALRIISQKYIHCSITDFRNKFNIPTLKSRREVFLLLKVFDILHNINNINNDMLYTNIKFKTNNRLLRSNSDNLLGIPKCNKVTFGQRSFNYIGPKLWNSLPSPIRNINNRQKFKSEIKSFLYKY